MNKSLLEALEKLRTENPFGVLETPFLLLAFSLCVAGLIGGVLAEHEAPLKPFARCMLAVAAIAALPAWSGLIRGAAYFLPYQVLDYHTGLTGIYQRIAGAVNTAVSQPAFDFSLFDALGAVMMDFIAALLMRLIASLGSVVAVPLLFVQVGAEQLVITAMPAALAALTVPALRNAAQGFLAFWVSLLLWPLFFAAVTVIAGQVFTVSNQLGQLWADGGGSGGILTNFIAPFAAGAILLGGILSTPPLAYSLCAHGGAALSGPSPSLLTFLR